MSRQTTRQTLLANIPNPHNNVKCDPQSVGQCFAILCGVDFVENEPERYNSLMMWSKILQHASEEQLEKILQKHVATICNLLIGVIGEFKLEEMTEIFQNAVDYADDAVQIGTLKEGNYKDFSDVLMWMINVLKAIDSYNDSGDTYDIAFTPVHSKYNGRNIIEIYIYKPQVGTF